MEVTFLGEVAEVKSEFEQVLKDYLSKREKEAPSRVRGVARLKADFKLFMKLMSSEYEKDRPANWSLACRR
jgi:hypothetical protein